MPLYIFLNYVQTFMLFPGVANQRKPVFGLEKSGFTILLIVFNIFDIIGKSMPYYKFLNVM